MWRWAKKRDCHESTQESSLGKRGNYPRLLTDIKERIRAAQYEALKTVNKELVSLYWDIGRIIVERQETEGWGKSVVKRLSADLRQEFPGVSGFQSKTSGTCASSIRSTTAAKDYNHWLEK